MPKIYLAVGHGRKPSGAFDPGAVAPDGTREYDVARRVVEAAEPLIEARGVQVVSEVEGYGATMDPNYVGSTRQVNGKGYAMAVEVHLDWHKAPRGGFALYLTEAGKRIADAMHDAWRKVGLPQRANVKRTDLYFLKNTDCPAVLIEVDRVGADVAPGPYVARMAEAVARGVVAALGLAWEQPAAPAPRPAERPVQTPLEALGRIKDLVGHKVGRRWDVEDYQAVVDAVARRLGR